MKVEYGKGELIQLKPRQAGPASGRKTKVMLVFPPDWYPSEPYLSLPSLTCVLRAAGHDVIQKDVNLEMYDWYFSEDFLCRVVLKRVPQQLDRLRKLSRLRSLTEAERDLQLALVGLTRARMAELTEKAERAKRIVRTPEFYEADKLERAITTFREVTDTISLAYAPARICMPPMETDLSYKVFVSSEVLDAIEDAQVNVYRDVFEHILKPAIEADRPDVVGISIVLQQQIFSTMTFCKVIKEQFPNIHVTIGGNTVTRLRDVLPKTPKLFALFDSAVIYEGETAFLQLVEAVGAGRELAGIPNLMYRDASGIHASSLSYAEDMSSLPPPDFDGLPLEKYFIPHRILPYLATRGCYWGRCEFCDHGEGYTAGYRTKKVEEIIEEIRHLKTKYQTRDFHFTDEAYPPALFRKLTRRLVGTNIDIVWATHIRLEENKDLVHSIGFGTFDLSRHTPVAKDPERFGVTPYINPEWDLALDYYFTVKEGLSVEEAERVFEEFERNHYPGWDLKIFIREYVFLYVARFGTNKLPALQFRPPEVGAGDLSGVGA